MTAIAFIGVGRMGGPMARNLVHAGHDVAVFDTSAEALAAAVRDGARAASSPGKAVSVAETVITMLPEGRHVRNVYLEMGMLSQVRSGALLIDCSTIDIDSTRALHDAAARANVAFLDAPVSGGVGGAEAGTLTFMCGGERAAFERAVPVLEQMGKRIVLAGGAGAGQAAKICNNMLLAISMIGTCEAFALAEKLGLHAQKLFEIASVSSGQCWSLTSYCPVPGPVAAAPSNRAFLGGFAARLMLKDLELSQAAARSAGAATPLGAGAAQLYSRFCELGGADRDFSGIIEMLRDEIRFTAP